METRLKNQFQKTFFIFRNTSSMDSSVETSERKEDEPRIDENPQEFANEARELLEEAEGELERDPIIEVRRAGETAASAAIETVEQTRKEAERELKKRSAAEIAKWVGGGLVAVLGLTSLVNIIRRGREAEESLGRRRRVTGGGILKLVMGVGAATGGLAIAYEAIKGRVSIDEFRDAWGSGGMDGVKGVAELIIQKSQEGIVNIGRELKGWIEGVIGEAIGGAIVEDAREKAERAGEAMGRTGEAARDMVSGRTEAEGVDLEALQREVEEERTAEQRERRERMHEKYGPMVPLNEFMEGRVGTIHETIQKDIVDKASRRFQRQSITLGTAGVIAMTYAPVRGAVLSGTWTVASASLALGSFGLRSTGRVVGRGVELARNNPVAAAAPLLVVAGILHQKELNARALGEKFEVPENEEKFVDFIYDMVNEDGRVDMTREQVKDAVEYIKKPDMAAELIKRINLDSLWGSALDAMSLEEAEIPKDRNLYGLRAFRRNLEREKRIRPENTAKYDEISGKVGEIMGILQEYDPLDAENHPLDRDRMNQIVDEMIAIAETSEDFVIVKAGDYITWHTMKEDGLQIDDGPYQIMINPELTGSAEIRAGRRFVGDVISSPIYGGLEQLGRTFWQIDRKETIGAMRRVLSGDGNIMIDGMMAVFASANERYCLGPAKVWLELATATASATIEGFWEGITDEEKSILESFRENLTLTDVGMEWGRGMTSVILLTTVTDLTTGQARRLLRSHGYLGGSLRIVWKGATYPVRFPADVYRVARRYAVSPIRHMRGSLGEADLVTQLRRSGVNTGFYSAIHNLYARVASLPLIRQHQDVIQTHRNLSDMRAVVHLLQDAQDSPTKRGRTRALAQVEKILSGKARGGTASGEGATSGRMRLHSELFEEINILQERVERRHISRAIGRVERQMEEERGLFRDQQSRMLRDFEVETLRSAQAEMKAGNHQRARKQLIRMEKRIEKIYGYGSLAMEGRGLTPRGIEALRRSDGIIGIGGGREEIMSLSNADLENRLSQSLETRAADLRPSHRQQLERIRRMSEAEAMSSLETMSGNEGDNLRRNLEDDYITRRRRIEATSFSSQSDRQVALANLDREFANTYREFLTEQNELIKRLRGEFNVDFSGRRHLLLSDIEADALVRSGAITEMPRLTRREGVSTGRRALRGAGRVAPIVLVIAGLTAAGHLLSRNYNPEWSTENVVKEYQRLADEADEAEEA